MWQELMLLYLVIFLNMYSQQVKTKGKHFSLPVKKAFYSKNLFIMKFSTMVDDFMNEKQVLTRDNNMTHLRDDIARLRASVIGIKAQNAYLRDLILKLEVEIFNLHDHVLEIGVEISDLFRGRLEALNTGLCASVIGFEADTTDLDIRVADVEARLLALE